MNLAIPKIRFQANERMYQPSQKESIFDTPSISGAQRTSYKKGPPGGPYQSPVRNSYLGQNKGYPDYDYYSDPFGSFADSAYQNSRRGMNRMPYFRDSSKLYPTTPGYKINRNRYRDRYPSASGRVGRDKESTSEKTTMQGMKEERRKRHIEENQQLYGIILNSFKAKPDIPQRQSSKQFNIDDKQIKDQLNDIYLKRKRRHVGPHDEDGLQRLLSTGSLAPSSLPQNSPLYNHSIDFVFATYWFFPAKTQAILPQDQKCIEEKMSEEKQRFDPKSKLISYYSTAAN